MLAGNKPLDHTSWTCKHLTNTVDTDLVFFDFAVYPDCVGVYDTWDILCRLPEKGGKKDRRDSRDEREGRKRNRNEREETEEIKTFPLYPYPKTGLAQLLDAPVT